MNLAHSTISDRCLDLDEQRAWVAQLQEVMKASPLVRPTARGGLAMRVKVGAAGSLGWVGDGAYRYSPTDSRGNPWPPMPEEWAALANEVVGGLWMDDPPAGPADGYPWDCAIINWYAPDGFGPLGRESARLGWHRDIGERDLTLPIVTVSLGDACSWAVRADEDEPVHRTRLESGQVTVLAGRLRLALHTVERIIPAPMFSPLDVRGRVSVTLRVAG